MWKEEDRKKYQPDVEGEMINLEDEKIKLKKIFEDINIEEIRSEEDLRKEYIKLVPRAIKIINEIMQIGGKDDYPRLNAAVHIINKLLPEQVSWRIEEFIHLSLERRMDIIKEFINRRQIGKEIIGGNNGGNIGKDYKDNFVEGDNSGSD